MSKVDQPVVEAPSKPAAVIPLPYDLLAKLIGRKVTVFLSVKNEELYGVLRSVDEDRGDLFLEDVSHYVWTQRERNVEGEIHCTGGGYKVLARKCRKALVSSKYIDGISPTTFNEAEPAL